MKKRSGESPPRLLLIMPCAGQGGTEAYALKTAGAALRRGWEVHVAFPDGSDAPHLVDEFRALGAIHHRLTICDDPPADMGPRGQMVRVVRSLRLLRRLRPDVVQSQVTWPTKGLPPALACAILGIPVQLVFHNAPRRKALPRWQVRAGRWSRARGQDWVAVSRHVARKVARSYGLERDRLKVIYNGIDRPLADHAPTDVRQRLGISVDAPLVVAVGRVETNKGVHDLVSAVPHVADQVPSVQFMWAGVGSRIHDVSEQVAALGLDGVFEMLGQRQDVPDLLGAADLFVHPSWWEGFPFAILEAMAAGVPVVATDAPGTRELVTDGEDGLLVPVRDPERLAEAIVVALTHPERMRELAEAASARVAPLTEEAMTGTALDRMERLIRTSG